MLSFKGTHFPKDVILYAVFFLAITYYHFLLLMRGARFKRNHIAVVDSDCGECVG